MLLMFISSTMSLNLRFTDFTVLFWFISFFALVSKPLVITYFPSVYNESIIGLAFIPTSMYLVPLGVLEKDNSISAFGSTAFGFN